MGIADDINQAAQGLTKPTVKQQLTSDLQTRLNAADAAYRQQYGKPLPVTSTVRSREQQSVLYANRGANAYPVAAPGTSLHETGNAFDVDRNVPEPFLNQFGLHRPIKNDPVHVQAMPDLNAKQEAKIAGFSFGPETESYFEQPAEQQPKSIAESIDIAAQQVPEISTAPTVADSKLKWFGRKAASYADIVTGIPGQVGKLLTELGGYATARGFVPVEGVAAPGLTAEESQQAVTQAQGGTAEQAQAAREKAGAMISEKWTAPIGSRAKVTETPEYQSTIPMELLSAVNTYGIEPTKNLLVKAGMSKADASALVDAATFALPAAVSKVSKLAPVKAATGAVSQATQVALSKVTPVIKAELRNAVSGFSTKQPAPKLGEPAPAGATSVGAAATSPATLVQQALTTATPEMQALFKDIPIDKANIPAVQRHLEADSLPVPVRLTAGQATGDIAQISHEMNLRGQNPELAYRLNEQNQGLVNNLEEIRHLVAPDAHSTKMIEASQGIIDAYKALDETKNTAIRDAYKKLEDANGGQFPVDGAALVQKADAALHAKLKSEFLPSSIRNQLDRFAAGEPMTFENYEALRTNLAAEIRKAERTGDGNAIAALREVYKAADELPMTGVSKALKPLADEARRLARERFDALDKDPAYRAAVNDTVAPDKYFDKFVINGVNKNLETMVNTFGAGSPAHQHMAAGAMHWLSDKAGIVDGQGNFSQAGFNKALKKLEDVKNLQQIFTPEGQTYLRTLGNVAGYTQKQPRGAWVNNSNTLVGYLADKGKNALEAGANVAGLKTVGYPLGSEVRRVVRAGRERKFAQEALAPGAGSTLKQISQTGTP